MKKTYKTLEGQTVIVVKTPKGSKKIEFKKGYIVTSLRGGLYTTEDEGVQQGIEAHPRFMSGFNDQIWTDDNTSDNDNANENETRVESPAVATEEKPRRARRYKAEDGAASTEMEQAEA